MAGGFKKSIDICGSETLTEVRRQNNPADREAVKLLSQYRTHDALTMFEETGSIIIEETELAADSRLVDDYVEAYTKKAEELDRSNHRVADSLVVCSHTNASVVKFNSEIRERLKQNGILKYSKVGIVGLFRRKGGVVNVGNKRMELLPGEQIVFTGNLNYEESSDVFNSEVGTVLSVNWVDKQGFGYIAVLVNKADGSLEQVVLDTKKLSEYPGSILDYGYAVTAYKLQGATIDQTFIRHGSNIGYETFNVMMSRHRENVWLYADRKTLHDALYATLDKNIVKARYRYNLEAKPGQNLDMLGLKSHIINSL
ncbi:MAG: hypothetical protein COA94_03075 [Rickettsiales bacterium]|nr:MAG: hypothetical protein COA94_03075 [Rickettsiales bacterium]